MVRLGERVYDRTQRIVVVMIGSRWRWLGRGDEDWVAVVEIGSQWSWLGRGDGESNEKQSGDEIRMTIDDGTEK